MAQQIGNYTLLNKAQVNVTTGAVTIVAQLVETPTGKIILDNVPTANVNTIKANLQAVSGQYDVIGV